MYFVESWTNKHSQPLNCAIRQQWLNHRACKTGILVSPIYNGCLFTDIFRKGAIKKNQCWFRWLFGAEDTELLLETNDGIVHASRDVSKHVMRRMTLYL